MSKSTKLTIIGVMIAAFIAVSAVFVLTRGNSEGTPPPNASTPTQTRIGLPATEPTSKATGDPTETATAAPVAKTETPTPQPTSSEDAEFNNRDPYKGAVAKGTQNFSDKEVQEAISFVARYANASLTNRYFLGGQWAKDGFPMETLHEQLRAWYVDSAIADVPTLKEDKEGQELNDAILARMMFFAENDTIAPSDECAVGKESSYCTTPIKFSKVNYYEAPDTQTEQPVLVLEFTAEYDLAVTIKDGNKPAKTRVKYDYALEVVRSDREDGTEGFLIDDIKTSYNLSKVSEES